MRKETLREVLREMMPSIPLDAQEVVVGQCMELIASSTIEDVLREMTVFKACSLALIREFEEVIDTVKEENKDVQ